MLISSTIIGSLALAAVLTFLAPIIILIVLCAKRMISPKPMWFGVLAFFISQICLRLPILSVLKKQSWFLTFAKQRSSISLPLLLPPDFLKKRRGLSAHGSV